MLGRHTEDMTPVPPGTTNDITGAARAAYAAGLCPIPVKGDGSKAPAVTRWRHWQDERYPECDLDGLFTNAAGMGLVCGAASGNLELVEFEANAIKVGLWPQFVRKMAQMGFDDTILAVTRGYLAKSPTGGVHMMYKVEGWVGPNTKLAMRGKDTLIETRGQGGFVVVPPSGGTVHPTGLPWVQVEGGFGTIATISPVEREAILEAARSFHVEPPAAVPVSALERRPAPRDGGDSPADWVRKNVSVSKLLVEGGWTLEKTRGAETYWVRPDKDAKAGHSAVLHDDEHLVVWSSSAPTEFWSLGRANRDGSRSLSPFDVYTAVHFGGDRGAAASHIRRTTDVPASQPPAPTGDAPAGEVGGSPGASLNLPPEFWEARDWLTQVRDAAFSRMLSPDAVLGALLARVAATVPTCYIIPPIVAAKATFDHLTCIVGRSSGGKSAAMAVAEELMPDTLDKVIRWDFPAPSGEGLIEAFFDFVEVDDGKRKKREKRQVFHAVHFSIDEAMSLIQTSQRQGTTIGSVLCSAWAGQTIGQGNASEDRKRVLKKGKARVSGVMGIQSALGHHFLTDSLVEQGLTGRITWFAAEAGDQLPPLDELPPFPGPLAVTPLPVIHGTIEFDYDPGIWAQVRQEFWERQAGKRTEAAVDGHLRLVRLKIAGLLAAIESRTTVDLADWALAGEIVDSSKRIRLHMGELAAAASHRALVTQGTAQAVREMAAEDTKEQRAITRLQASIEKAVASHTEGISVRKLARATTSAGTRHRFDDALAAAVAAGTVVVDGEHARSGVPN